MKKFDPPLCLCVRSQAAAPLLTDLAIQDSVGKASNASTPGHVTYAVGCLDAAWHANISKAALSPPAFNVSTTVNMELFLRKGHRSPPSARSPHPFSTPSAHAHLILSHLHVMHPHTQFQFY